MATLFVDKIDPQSGTTLSLGSSGDTLQATAGTTNNLGISSAQEFRLAASQAGSGSLGTVLTNWEENDTDYQAIGSNWSQSSVYLVVVQLEFIQHHGV